MPGPTSFLVNGSMIEFFPPAPAVFVPPLPPLPLVISTEPHTATERGLTVLGNEVEWALSVPPAPYSTPTYSVPGMLKCTKIILNPSHISQTSLLNDIPVLRVGSTFTVIWAVTTPAQTPPPPSTPDPTPMYTGEGQFIQAMDSMASSSG